MSFFGGQGVGNSLNDVFEFFMSYYDRVNRQSYFNDLTDEKFSFSVLLMTLSLVFSLKK